MKVAIVHTKAPFDGVYARETQDLVLALAAVDYELSLVFCDDAVYQLLPGTDSAALKIKDLRPRQKLFELYDIDRLYVCAESLRQRQLTAEQLQGPVQLLEGPQLNQLLASQQHLIGA
ncbi:sulfurtransferase complex subunit TusC [Rheinheimera sp.]|uniref:sulfurtransferase complex subunit TusC n=1 Tax=Rheinheimera sp. TaxID=1869214 RepID=UPI00307E363D